MAEEYEGMTVAELKALLKERGLPVSGKKSELIERLSDNQEEEIVDTQEIESPAADESAADEDFEDDADEDWDDDWEDDEDEGHVAKQKLSLIHI